MLYCVPFTCVIMVMEMYSLTSLNKSEIKRELMDAFMLACQNGHTQIAELLLKNKLS